MKIISCLVLLLGFSPAFAEDEEGPQIIAAEGVIEACVTGVSKADKGYVEFPGYCVHNPAADYTKDKKIVFHTIGQWGKSGKRYEDCYANNIGKELQVTFASDVNWDAETCNKEDKAAHFAACNHAIPLRFLSVNIQNAKDCY